MAGRAGGHLRIIIRESIQRDGYIDAVYRPVEQQPRRGRPPQGEITDGAETGPDALEVLDTSSAEVREQLPEKTRVSVEAPAQRDDSQFDEPVTLASSQTAQDGIPDAMREFLTG